MTFFSRRPQRPSKYTFKSNPSSKNCPNNWLLLWLGVHFVSRGGALTHFPCKLRLKKICHRPGGAGAPTAPPGYAYGGNFVAQIGDKIFTTLLYDESFAVCWHSIMLAQEITQPVRWPLFCYHQTNAVKQSVWTASATGHHLQTIKTIRAGLSIVPVVPWKGPPPPGAPD